MLKLFKWQIPVRLINTLITIAFILLAIGYSTGPIFEAPDEIEHYRYIRHVQRENLIPDPFSQPYGQYHQTPLYYWLLQPLAAFFPNDDDFEQIDGRLNPNHGYREDLPGNDNKNLYIHTRAEDFPYTNSQTALAVHIFRLFSVAAGAITVLLSQRIFALLWANKPYRQVIALAILAFWHKFIYMSAVINNDTLAITLATISFYLLLHQQKYGATWRKAALLGLILGAALLTKSSLAMLALPVGIATLMDRKLWKYAVLTFIVTVIVAGWWYLRNILLYDDLLGLRANFVTWPDQPLANGQLALDLGLQRVPYAYTKVWARFGYGAVVVPAWLYRLFDGLLLISIVGLIPRLIQHIRGQKFKRDLVQQGIIVVVFILTWLLSVTLSSSMQTAGNQGRYVLPGIAAMVVLITLGLETWLFWLNKTFAALTISISLFLLALYVLFGHFLPAYQPIPVPDNIPRYINIRYGDTAELMGMSPPELRAKPGETLSLELYWRALNPDSPDLQVYVHTIDGENFFWRDSLPGNGHRPAQDWQPGDTWGERYVFTVPDTTVPGTQYIIVGGLYSPSQGSAIEAFDPAGNSLSNTPLIAYLNIIE